MLRSEVRVSEAGPAIIEGSPGQPVMTSVGDAGEILEACFSNGVSRVLLYSENLTPGFFDLSSREAADILQKFRNYGVRLAIVCSPNLQTSRRFPELIAEENRATHARFCRDRSEAVDWLRSI